MDMRVSHEVMEWQNKAQVELQRANILRALKKRCKSATIPTDLILAILAATDLSILMRWFDAALDANSFEEFRDAIKPQD